MLSLLDLSFIRDNMDITIHENTLNKEKYMKESLDDENKFKI